MRKIFLGIIVILLLIFKILDFASNQTDDLMVEIKLANFQKAYKLANSTILFNNYNYIRYSNLVLAHYYMFAIENRVKQDFKMAEKYCLIDNLGCDIVWLYKEAISYYCGEKLVEYPAFGYKPKHRIEFHDKCVYSKKRHKELETLGNKAYELPWLYWLPRL